MVRWKVWGGKSRTMIAGGWWTAGRTGVTVPAGATWTSGCGCMHLARGVRYRVAMKVRGSEICAQAEARGGGNATELVGISTMPKYSKRN